jgi:hypothetical protein
MGNMASLSDWLKIYPFIPASSKGVYPFRFVRNGVHVTSMVVGQRFRGSIELLYCHTCERK